MGADWARTMKALDSIQCEVFLSSNGVYFDMAKKHEALMKNPDANPFIDPAGCHAFVERSEATYQNLLKTLPPAASAPAPTGGSK
jgi:hypothetical protein